MSYSADRSYYRSRLVSISLDPEVQSELVTYCLSMDLDMKDRGPEWLAQE